MMGGMTLGSDQPLTDGQSRSLIPMLAVIGGSPLRSGDIPWGDEIIVRGGHRVQSALNVSLAERRAAVRRRGP